MKLTTLLFFVALIQVSANSYAQTRISLKFEKETLESVFSKIEASSEFSIFYKNDLIKDLKEITGEYKDASVNEILDQILKSGNLTYTIKGKLIMIVPIAEPAKGNNDQQQKSVSGNVTDSSGGSLPGVSVVVKGTTTGTITDADGNYSIKNVQTNATLQFSFVGMKSQEIVVGNQTTIDVSLSDESIGLQEVIAVGYGTQTKRNVTGSIQTVSAEDLKDIPVAQITQALQGKVSGVQISQTTGVPGEAMNIRVRGQGSISAGSDPLYVVDGFPITGKLTDLNPEEIESITILKDAASTSLYGSRAANGVILVQTKRAKVGQTKIDFSTYFGVQTLPKQGRPDMMNATEFAQFKKESYEDLGLAVPTAFQNPESYGKGTDWFDLILRPAPVQEYTMTMTSGTEKLRTSAVAGYYNQDGILINSGYQRYNVRINTEFKASEKFKFGFNIAPSLSKYTTPSKDGAFFTGSLINNSLLAWPTLKYQNEDGTLPLTAYTPGLGGFPTPNYYRAAKEITGETNKAKVLTNAFIELEPIKDLVLKSSMNFQYESSKYKYFNPSTASTGFAVAPPITSFANLNNQWLQTWLLENTATYKKSFDSHNFELLAGYTTQKFKSNYTSISVQNFADDRIRDVDAATIINPTGTDEDIQEWSMISYLSRLNYNYKDKYMLSASIRRDGSSRFGEDNLWGNFPSVSAGWLVSEENFFPKDRLISTMKLRASWGVTGNNNIGNYTHYALVNLGESAVFNNSIESGSAVSNISNKNLGWEKTSQIDLGVDVAFLKNRINVAYDFYSKKTNDLLYNFSIAPSSGYTNFIGNSGELKFWGHEFSVDAKIFTGSFKWNSSFNISFSNNKVVALTDNVQSVYAGRGIHITKVGQRIGLFWGMVHDGVYDNKAEYDNSAKAPSSAVGTIKFKDINNDGKILNTNTGGDMVVIGDPNPDFLYGFTNNFSYKDFDLSISCSGSYGNDIANMFEQGATNLDGPFNVLRSVKDRWRSPENPGSGLYGTTKYSTFMERDWFNTRFIQDGSYLTIKNVTLGYTFDVSHTKLFKNLRVYASVQQLYTFTKYNGNNPEVSTNFNGTPVSVLAMGDDYAAYPVPRTWTFGINVGF